MKVSSAALGHWINTFNPILEQTTYYIYWADDINMFSQNTLLYSFIPRLEQTTSFALIQIWADVIICTNFLKNYEYHWEIICQVQQTTLSNIQNGGGGSDWVVGVQTAIRFLPVDLPWIKWPICGLGTSVDHVVMSRARPNIASWSFYTILAAEQLVPELTARRRPLRYWSPLSLPNIGNPLQGWWRRQVRHGASNMAANTEAVSA
jgi:hypothetical protein